MHANLLYYNKPMKYRKWLVVTGFAGTAVAGLLLFVPLQRAGTLSAQDSARKQLHLWSDLPLAAVRRMLPVPDRAATDPFAVTAEQVQVRSYFPHLGDVAIPSLGSLKSTLILANSNFEMPVSGEVTFTSSSGAPLPFPAAGGTSSRWSFQLRPGEIAVLESLGISTMATAGWGVVESNAPLAGTILFQFVRPDGETVTEAGIGSAVPKRTFSILVEKRGKINTGVGIANPSAETAQIEVRLRGGEIVLDSVITLQARAHRAFFIDELGSPFDSFYGTLLLRASQDIVVTSLRTFSGLPLASLPAG